VVALMLVWKRRGVVRNCWVGKGGQATQGVNFGVFYRIFVDLISFCGIMQVHVALFFEVV